VKKFKKIVVGAFVICGLLLPSAASVSFAEKGKMDIIDTATDIMTLVERGAKVLVTVAGVYCLFRLPGLAWRPLYGAPGTHAWVHQHA
jgi:hypothetical protein